MKKLLIAVLLALNTICGGIAIAQDDISLSTGIVGNGKYLGAKTTDGQTTVPVIGVDSSGNTTINSLSGKSVSITIAKTPVSVLGGTPYTAVFASTAVAVTNQLRPGYNIAGATATANHLVLVGGPTPVLNTEYEFYNPSTASLKLKMPPGVTMNGATAGGTLVVAAKTSARCKVVAAADIACTLGTNPTPAAA